MSELQDNFPPILAAALEKIQTVMPDAVIAGGSLRDLDHGVPFKDVDVFFCSTPEDFAWQVSNIMRAFGLHMMDRNIQQADTTEYEEWSGGIAGVQSVNFQGVTFELIGLGQIVTMDTVCDRIDLGLCKIAYNGRVILRTHAYLQDKLHATFTADPQDMTYFNVAKTMIRVNRFQDRYPGYPLIVRPFDVGLHEHDNDGEDDQ